VSFNGEGRREGGLNREWKRETYSELVGRESYDLETFGVVLLVEILQVGVVFGLSVEVGRRGKEMDEMVSSSEIAADCSDPPGDG